MHILSVLVAPFKFNFSVKPLLISVVSDPLSRNALAVTVLEPFEMVIVIICKKVCGLTECEFIVAARLYLEDLEMFHGAMCGAIVRSYLFYSESVSYNFEQNGF